MRKVSARPLGASDFLFYCRQNLWFTEATQTEYSLKTYYFLSIVSYILHISICCWNTAKTAGHRKIQHQEQFQFETAETVPPGFALVYFDVVSLFTSIDLELATQLTNSPWISGRSSVH
jgi:hypothetical protein